MKHKSNLKYSVLSGSILLILQFITTKIMEINTPFWYQVIIYIILLAIINGIIFYLLRNKKDVELSPEIDHNLKLIHDFWKEIHICSTTPMTLAQHFSKAQQVVAEIPFSMKVHIIRKDLYLADPPCWQHKEFAKPTSLSILSEEKQQGVRQFYDKLDTITSIYEKLRTSNGPSIINELEERLEAFVTEVLKQGSPLENHNNMRG